VGFRIHRIESPVRRAAGGIEHLVGIAEIGVFHGEAGGEADTRQPAVAVIGRGKGVRGAIDGGCDLQRPAQRVVKRRKLSVEKSGALRQEACALYELRIRITRYKPALRVTD
jgi:hypothetical protein